MNHDDDDLLDIPEEHKELVRERIKMAKEHPEMMLNWGCRRKNAS